MIEQGQLLFIVSLGNIDSCCMLIVNCLVYVLRELGIINHLSTRSLNRVLTLLRCGDRALSNVSIEFLLMRRHGNRKLLLMHCKLIPGIFYPLTCVRIVALWDRSLDITPWSGSALGSPAILFFETLRLIHLIIFLL